MGEGIIKIKDRYLIWSSHVDEPVTSGMTLEELKEYWREEYGRHGMYSLEIALRRVEEKGTSSAFYESVEDHVRGNFAGPNRDPEDDSDEGLTVDEIYDAYCLFKPVRGGWMPTWDEVDPKEDGDA